MTIFFRAATAFGALAVIVAASLLAPPARAASEAVLYSFKGAPDGANPQGTLLKVGDMLYGTTFEGGTYNKGTVFSISPQGVEKVLWSFGNGDDGEYPNGTLVELNGVLYGTTQVGGKPYDGTVFSITPAGVYHVIWNFGTRGANNRPDGTDPHAGLIAVGDTLWGTTIYGGFHGTGTVFSITPAGAETVVYNFRQYYSAPTSELLYANGLLYGATDGSGTGGNGLIFSVTPSGVEKDVYIFPVYTSGSASGAYPNGLISIGARLYGTAAGGTNSYGIVYSLTPAGTVKALYNFGPPTIDDGAAPDGLMLNVGGTFYGNTQLGGEPNSARYGGGCGAVFSVTAAGVETVLYAFQGNSFTSYADGCYPYGTLTEIGAKFYGVTSEGGAYSAGTVFSISR
jgi:uncharacterized repeat protein (TIGR03803 family)